MRAGQRTERGELEPADVQFAGKLAGRDEAADVGAPIRNPAQSGIDRDWHMRLERSPRRLYVARPQERRIPLHTCVSVAVKSIDSLVRTIHPLPLEIHPVARQPRSGVVSIALIGPPAIHAE